MAELRGLGAVHEALQRMGGTILAIAADPQKESRRVVESNNLQFPILSDVDRRVIRDYGLLHSEGSPQGGDIAIPAHVLISSGGEIVWRRVSSRVQDRPTPEEVLEQVHGLNPK